MNVIENKELDVAKNNILKWIGKLETDLTSASTTIEIIKNYIFIELQKVKQSISKLKFTNKSILQIGNILMEAERLISKLKDVDCLNDPLQNSIGIDQYGNLEK